MHALSTRELAIQLRNEGYSYPYISQRTGLSKSTLSGWLTEIPYTPNQETVDAFGKARAAAGKQKALVRQRSLEKIRIEANKEIGTVSQRDLFMFGLGLYLGEGGKTGNLIRIVNADPRVIQACVAWFTDLGVSVEQFAPRLHLYPDNDIDECLRFWSVTTGIPIVQFQKTYVDIRTNKSQNKKGKLPHGTLHLGVRSLGKKEYGVLFFRMIQSWGEEVLKQVKRN